MIPRHVRPSDKKTNVIQNKYVLGKDTPGVDSWDERLLGNSTHNVQ